MNAKSWWALGVVTGQAGQARGPGRFVAATGAVEPAKPRASAAYDGGPRPTPPAPRDPALAHSELILEMVNTSRGISAGLLQGYAPGRQVGRSV